MGVVRKVDGASNFGHDQIFIDKYILYRRTIGTINQKRGDTWLVINSLNTVTIPMKSAITQAGFTNRQLVDIHVIYAVTGKSPAPTKDEINQQILAPSSPPGCITVCFEHVGKMRWKEQDRVIEMSGEEGLDNGGELTIPAEQPNLDWVQPGVPYTVYEIYLVSPVDGFPVEMGRAIIEALALRMSPLGA